MTFAIRRVRAQSARLALVAVIGLLCVLGIGGVDALSGVLVADGVQRVAAKAEPGARFTTLSALRAPDAVAQDREIRAAIADAFPGLAIEVTRQEAVTISSGNADALEAMGEPRIAELAELAEGRWPAAQGEAAVLEAAAAARGWRVGDTVPLGVAAGTREPIQAVIVGLWSAADPSAPVWHGDPAVASGRLGAAAGPVLLDDADLARLADTPTATWTIVPRGLHAEDLGRFQDALSDLALVPKSIDPQNQRSTQVGGRLADTVDRAADAVTAARGLSVVPLVIVAVLGGIALAVALSALAGARREELFLLRSRGASAAGIAGRAAVEAGAAAAIGAVLAVGALAAFPVRGALMVAGSVAVGAVIAAAVLAAVTAVRSSHLGERSRDDAGRRGALVLAVPFVLVAVAAGLAFWQLLGNGSFRGPDGRADPLASAAPALLLVAACLLAPILASPLAAVSERVAARGSGISPVLPLRQIARRTGAAAAAILSLSLAAAALALAGAWPLVSAQAEQRALSATLGADVRVIDPGPGSHVMDAAAAAALPAATGAVDVWRDAAAIGAESTAFLALDPQTAALDPALASALRSAPGPADEGVPGAITASLARLLGAEIGTRVQLQLRGAAVSLLLRVAAIVPDLPGIGAEPGVLVGVAPARAAASATTWPGPNEVWIRSADPEATTAALRGVATVPARILTPGAVSTAPVTGSGWAVLLAGSVAAAALSALGFWAATATAAASRREETEVLLALGLARARQRRIRTGEILGIAVYAVLLGALIGAAVAVGPAAIGAV